MIRSIKQYLVGNAPLFGYGDERTFIIVECNEMPSCIGMTCTPKPVIKKPFKVSKDKNYRTLTALKIEDFDGGFFAHTKHLTVKFLEL